MQSAQRFVSLVNDGRAHAPLDLLWATLTNAMRPAAVVGSMLTSLDRLAERVEPSFEGVMRSLFGDVPTMFAGDLDDYHSPANSMLDQVIERRLGMPISLSMIAIEVGRRIGVPILGVGTPGHFVVRDARSELYADPFGGGVIYDRDGIVDLCQRRTGVTAIPTSALAPVSARQIMVRVVHNLTASLTRAPARHVADPRIFHLVGIRQGLPEFAEEADQWPALLRHWN